MTELIPAGTDVGPGTYRCDGCGFELTFAERRPLEPCSSCGMGAYEHVPVHRRSVAGDRRHVDT